MPKTNSESDFGGSITSDESDVDAGPSSPVAASHPPGKTFQSSPPVSSQKNLNMDTYVNPSTKPPSPINARSTSPTRPVPSRTFRLATRDVATNDVSATSTLKGAARFRATARKVMQMRQTSSFLGAFRGAGAEPGIDPRRASAVASYGHIREKCAIQVVDYSSLRSKSQTFDNKGFINFLEEHGTRREPWAKVRWISIGGISWDVISTLALTYDLHPLSLEDVLHRRGHVRSKADYFARHLFLRVLCHSLGDSDAINNPAAYTSAHAEAGLTNITTLPRSSSPTAMRSGSTSYDDKDLDAGYDAGDDLESSEKSQTGLFRRKSRGIVGRKPTMRDLETGPGSSSSQQSRTTMQVTAQAIATIDQLKAGQRVNVLLKNLFMFLLRDGTLVSIHQTNTSDFAQPILNRLRRSDTVLRTTADPSLLLESILDLVVDQAVEVVEEYQKMIFKLEHEILLKPKMRSVRHLHILSGDLTLHKRTLEPLKSLVYGLRRYDDDRYRAVTASSAEDATEPDPASRKVVGYMSHKSKVYLADVHDHVEYILSSLDMFASISENLINYTFNMASYEMNEVMRRLTLATIIFLPLTLLTGYFGMNFEAMWSVNEHSDALFWYIAVPVMAAVIPLFMWPDIIRMKHFFEKKMDIRRVRRAF